MAADIKLARRDALGVVAGELAAAGSEAVRIELVPFRSAVNLRGPATEEFVRAVAAATGIALPLEPNRWTGEPDRAAVWLGADEWLVVAPDGEAQAIEQAVLSACPKEPWLSIVDVSHNYTVLRLSGPGARDLLAKGCALDLHHSAFGAGDCAQSLLAKMRVLLLAVDDGSSIELWVRNSFAQYAVQWLLDAAAEFQRKETAS